MDFHRDSFRSSIVPVRYGNSRAYTYTRFARGYDVRPARLRQYNRRDEVLLTISALLACVGLYFFFEAGVVVALYFNP